MIQPNALILHLEPLRPRARSGLACRGENVFQPTAEVGVVRLPVGVAAAAVVEAQRHEACAREPFSQQPQRMVAAQELVADGAANTSAGASQTSDSAKQLSEMAVHLQALIKTFTLA